MFHEKGAGVTYHYVLPERKPCV